MHLPHKKTKIIATIGPASNSKHMLKSMIQEGMNIARLNFAHGDFESHRQNIQLIRETAAELNEQIAIFGDLPGPKMRIGKLAHEPIMLRRGQPFTLQTIPVVGDEKRVSVSFDELPEAVGPGDTIFLNDGFIQLKVEKVVWPEVHTYVMMGGELRSYKGVNFPDMNLGIDVFTEEDHGFLKFAAEEKLDAVSLSFVQQASDIQAVRDAAEALDYHPFIIAKIERYSAIEDIDAILKTADGIMIARGDLGVELPIEEIALVQKELIHKANLAGKPVITATQMLESMTYNQRPTRAEVTDVTNAILDGTDCVMLSGESAMGVAPDKAVAMMTHISALAEGRQDTGPVVRAMTAANKRGDIHPRDRISLSLAQSVEMINPTAVFVPTRTGGTARRISRYRIAPWIIAVSINPAVYQKLQFSYGVYPVLVPEWISDWETFAHDWLELYGLDHTQVMLLERPPSSIADSIIRMDIIDFGSPEHD